MPDAEADQVYYAAICRACRKRVVIVGPRPTNPNAERSVRCARCQTTNACQPMLDPDDDSNHRPTLGYGGKQVSPYRELLVDAERDDVVTFEEGAQ